ncbi:haloacid dehalogenase type II [uncultured Serinicoccus sp.]|uniref:haloacid dehalogenase type II n=1 Tax=uncultured Serinicoccus sp. TaxID=735514 RepID=UPI002607D00D|nr:haloacid dehalogenase type II [uncultured Serinicoccus sp.]
MTSAPALLIFDVNETLSDMSPMADRFVEVGAPRAMATTWFASLLRDGFALHAAGDNPRFADVGRAVLRPMLARELRHTEVEGAVEHVLAGFGRLALHQDVEAGVRRLHDAGVRLVTLSNGSTAVAQGLLERAGLLDRFERLLTVEDAPRWKPAPESYAYALEVCRVAPADAMLVAVHPWDLHGARAAGLRTAWVERGAARYPGHLAAPELTVNGIDDLARRLGAAES